jgi:hypothetical protein
MFQIKQQPDEVTNTPPEPRANQTTAQKKKTDPHHHPHRHEHAYIEPVSTGGSHLNPGAIRIG